MQTSDLKRPWIPVGKDAELLVRELRCELASTHPLSGCKVEAIARRCDTDDVLFEITGDIGPYAVAHLTWRGLPEPDGFPYTRLFPSFDAWKQDCMMKDHEDCARGNC